MSASLRIDWAIFQCMALPFEFVLLVEEESLVDEAPIVSFQNS